MNARENIFISFPNSLLCLDDLDLTNIRKRKWQKRKIINRLDCVHTPVTILVRRKKKNDVKRKTVQKRSQY